MHERLVLCVAFLATSVFGADHEMYHNCSRRPLCSNLRTKVLADDERYYADVQNYDLLHNTDVVLKLKNDKTEDLVLTINAIREGTFRLSIEEGNSTRYKLNQSLERELEPVSWGVTRIENDGTLVLMIAASREEKISITGKPFKMEFLYKVGDDWQLEYTIDSQRLFMSNADDDQSFAFGITFSNIKHFYGLSERSDTIALQHTADGHIDPYRLKNADNWAYEVNSTMAMYGSIPVLYGHGALTSGVFINNAAEQWIDIDNDNKSAYFMVAGGRLELFTFLGPTIKKVIRQYTNITGKFNLPQLWTLGYHQCRWGYFSSDDVEYVIDNFDEYNFPLDVIWLDFNWTDHGRYFLWNPVNYSDPIALLDTMAKTNRHLVVINDPHIKVDMNYSFYAGAKEKDLFVKNPDGTDYVGDCWPGDSSWLDFLNPEAQEYYGSYFSYDKLVGTPTLGGIWNDMNEPALFDETIEKTLPFESIHHGNVKHAYVHNLYGHTQVMSTYQGLLKRDNNQLRPFILTRSHFAGSQRYAAMWTGDNTSEWPYIALSYAMCLTSSLSGMPFCGADIGGFEGSPSAEMLGRWYQAGAWLPFMRAHANIDSQRREPYLYDDDTQEIIREAIDTRYSHVPVWYTLFYEHSLTGDPVIRPLFYHYPDDEQSLTVDDQVLVGSDILVKAVAEQGVDSVSVYLPGENDYWYQTNGAGKTYQGGQSVDIAIDLTYIPIFYRAGSIIVTKDDVQSSLTDMIDVPYNLYIRLNRDSTAQGRLYIDDYKSFEYKNSGAYSYVDITYDDATKQLTVNQIDSQSGYTDFDIIITEVDVQFLPDGDMYYEPKSYSSLDDGSALIDVNFKNVSSVILG